MNGEERGRRKECRERGVKRDFHFRLFMLFSLSSHFFSFSLLSTCAHNVIIGGMWVDHFGTLEIVNHTTGTCLRLFLLLLLSRITSLAS